jgi:hypothetical protein
MMFNIVDAEDGRIVLELLADKPTGKSVSVYVDAEGGISDVITCDEKGNVEGDRSLHVALKFLMPRW